MNARYYVSNTNRWLSPDTIVPDPTNPQSFNRYSYVQNNPVNFTDPSGHCMQYQENGDDEAFQVCHDAWIQLRDYIQPLTPEDGIASLYDRFLVPLYQTGTTERIVELLDIYDVEYEAPPAKMSQTQRPSFADVFFPDAFIMGASADTGGFLPSYTVGAEDLFLFSEEGVEVEAFVYAGSGQGAGASADAGGYGGLVWNLDCIECYSGEFEVLAIDASLIVGGEFSIFWSPTSDTWGVAITGTGGGGLSATYYEVDYIQIH